MSRSRWNFPLRYITTVWIKTNWNSSSHHLALRTTLTILTVLTVHRVLNMGAYQFIPMPLRLNQVFAIANRSLLATREQIAADNAVLSIQDVQMTAGPERASWLDINLSAHKVHLAIVQANNHLSSSGEVLSSMANRTGAIAGINGDYFDGTYNPIDLVEIDGQIIQSPGYHAVLGVTASGQITMGLEKFSGNITDGAASHVLNSINHHGDTHNGQLVLFTPALGISLSGLNDTIVMLQPIKTAINAYTVQTIQSNATTLPVLSDQDALVGSGEAGKWLASTLHPGDKIDISEHTSPDDNLVQAIGGGPVLIKNGALYKDPNPPAPTEASTRNPLTAIGVSKDGTHVFFVVFDGRLSGPNRSRGLTYTEMASYLLAHGAYQAMLFDGGGSSEMVARHPGQRTVSVVNHPSDGYERRISNGLFVNLV